MGQLNELQIKAAAPRDKEYLLADGEGLYLRVRPTGKVWVYRYKQLGKEAKLSLGHYPVVTLAAARKKARAEDPALTNAKCNFWHYRFESDSNVKISALVEVMKSKPDLKKVYLINQDYSFGQSVRSEARKQLLEKRPDVQIVGDELHPLLKPRTVNTRICEPPSIGSSPPVSGSSASSVSRCIDTSGTATVCRRVEMHACR
jgi:hypothetical protein